jgi:predicted dehydrogenase
MSESAKHTASRRGFLKDTGLMIRHCRARMALRERIDDGEIGDIIAMRAYRMSGKSTNAYAPARSRLGVPPARTE